jgi:hypothetical protein
MGFNWQDGGYSSEVKIWLLVDGARFEVAQIGPDTLTLRDDCEVRSGHAQILIDIDGRREIHDVIIGAMLPSKSELAYA